MANNRLFIINTLTNERLLLAKSFGAGWVLMPTDGQLDEWLRTHDDIASWGNCSEPSALRIVEED